MLNLHLSKTPYILCCCTSKIFNSRVYLNCFAHSSLDMSSDQHEFIVSFHTISPQPENWPQRVMYGVTGWNAFYVHKCGSSLLKCYMHNAQYYSTFLWNFCPCFSTSHFSVAFCRPNVYFPKLRKVSKEHIKIINSKLALLFMFVGFIFIVYFRSMLTFYVWNFNGIKYCRFAWFCS